jgi:probable rRNA maturation factor
VAVHFYFEETDSFPINKSRTRCWILTVIAAEKSVPGQLNIIFTCDEYLLNINREYLSHDYYTDVITFPAEKTGKTGGDVFISIDRIKENALLYKASFDEELRRVIVHGLLHLLGYSDSTATGKRKMTLLENKYLLLYK